jgi:hypothetical protein
MASAVVLALLAACSSGTAANDPTDPAEHPPHRPSSVAMSFGQLSSQVGTNRGLLRVVNEGEDDLEVNGVGLDWPGYGPQFLRAKDALLGPDQVVDFPVALPAPACGEASGGIVGLVATGAATLRQELEESGQRLLRRVRGQACEEELVHERVSIEYDESWRRAGAGRDASVLGALRLTRREGAEDIRLLAVQGSVLYDLDLPGASTLPAGHTSGRVPLRVTPGNRCDEHARSQVTAPFAFRLTLRIGGEEAEVPIAPPPGVQVRVTELLERACAGG